MSLDRSDWENMRAFLAVLRGGSLSAAARQLDVAQPTIRRRLEALEQQTGAALFVRSPTGLTPTSAAQELGAHAEAMDAAAAAFARSASARPEVVEGVVRITASEVVGGEVLPEMLSELGELHPDLRFELVLSNRAQDLLRQEADIAIRMVRPTQAAMVMKHVGAIQLGLFAATAYAQRHGLPTSLQELLNHRIVGPDRTAIDYKPMMEALGDPQGRTLRLRADDQVAQLACIRAGLGIGMCQARLAARAPVLVPVLPETVRFSLDTWVVMHEDLRRVPRVRAAFDFLAAALARYCSGT